MMMREYKEYTECNMFCYDGPALAYSYLFIYKLKTKGFGYTSNCHRLRWVGERETETEIEHGSMSLVIISTYDPLDDHRTMAAHINGNEHETKVL